jgi:hypothetical protein
MNRRYPPDADATDIFPVTDADIDTLLTLADEDLDLAFEHARELDLSYEETEDLLEWFGR